MASRAAPLPGDDAALKALQSAVDVLNAKWSVLVLARLSRGTHRFGELLRAVDGVSRRMLSATLKQLERDGLVERHVYARVPARVEYELSSAGEELLVALAAVILDEAPSSVQVGGVLLVLAGVIYATSARGPREPAPG